MTDTKMLGLDVQKSLSGVAYPASKQELINFAKSKSAPKEVVQALNSLPNRQFSNEEDVNSEMEGGM